MSNHRVIENEMPTRRGRRSAGDFRQRRLGLLLAVALHELVNAAFRVHHGLLARVVGMACGADVAGHCLHGGTRFNHVTASAGNGCVFVLRMDVFLHDGKAFQFENVFTL